MIENQQNFDFLIVGAGRGGTSLIAALLDYHSRLEVGFEYCSAACLMDEALDTATRLSKFQSLCEQEASRYLNKSWGNKITTEHIMALHLSNEAVLGWDNEQTFKQVFEQTFADKKVLFILRDGRSCILSKVRRTGKPIDLMCQRWLYSVACYRYLIEKKNPDRYYLFKFEQLLTQPVKVLQGVCEFLDIPYEQAMLQGVNNPKMRPDYRSSTINAEKISYEEQLPPALLELIKPALKYCQYIT